MKRFKIEVDEEIYLYLRDNHETFVDTDENSVLRKLLFKGQQSPTSTIINEKMELPSFDNGIPSALKQTLEMIYLVKKKGYNRTEATHIIAKKHGIATPTVTDKFCRQLGKRAFEIDRLLSNQSLADIKTLLVNRFNNHEDIVNKFFSNL